MILQSLPLLAQIVLGCLLGGVLSMVAAFAIMYGMPRRYLPMAVSFAAGTLLATAMLNLLPEALESAMRTALYTSGMRPSQVFPLLLAGILGFFLLERFTLWRHSHHHDQCDHVHEQTRQAPLILLGDAFHNFTDGILLAAAFLADPAVGWATAVAMVMHEVPQEAGDFALLLASGWGRRRALFWNGVSSLTNILGGILGYLVLESAQGFVPVALTLAAAGFIYIAVSDLLPRLRGRQAGIPMHIVLIGCGVAFVGFGSGHAHFH